MPNFQMNFPLFHEGGNLNSFAENIFSQIRDGVTISDAKTRDFPILFVNSAFERLTGYSSEETLNRNCRFLQGPETDQSDVAEIRGALKESKPCLVVLKNYRKNGQYFWNELSLSPIADETGAPRYIIGIQKDVTALRQLTMELAQANEKLQNNNRQLQNFADIAAHDIQEPNRKIQLFTDILRQDYAAALGPKGISHLNQVSDAAQRQRTLITGLMEYSRLVQDPAHHQMVSLHDALETVCADLSDLIQDAGIAIDIDRLPNVHGNHVLLTQLFGNLIGNAIRYRKPGVPLRISIYLEEQCLRPAQVCRICVEDNGIGFDQKHAEVIMLPFRRLEARPKIEGTGLGLAICSRIIEHHGGTLVAEGKPGVGAKFTVQLPLAEPGELE